MPAFQPKHPFYSPDNILHRLPALNIILIPFNNRLPPNIIYNNKIRTVNNLNLSFLMFIRFTSYIIILIIFHCIYNSIVFRQLTLHDIRLVYQSDAAFYMYTFIPALSLLLYNFCCKFAYQWFNYGIIIIIIA